MNMLDEAKEQNERILESIAAHDNVFLDLYFEESKRIDEAAIIAALRRGIISMDLHPVHCGTKHKNQ